MTDTKSDTLAWALLAVQKEMPAIQPNAKNPRGLIVGPGTGTCQCGCGRETKRAPQTYSARGIRKGDFWRFIKGHSRQTHHQSQTKAYQHNAALKHHYGITREDYLRMAAEQDGCCYLCRKPTKRLVVDHDHSTGRVRRLLCNTCNTRLWAVENAAFLETAHAYLKEFS